MGALAQRMMHRVDWSGTLRLTGERDEALDDRRVLLRPHEQVGMGVAHPLAQPSEVDRQCGALLGAAAQGMRSAFAARFSNYIGMAPMQYLTQWRLTLAAQALRAGSESIARIAERSGYDSEAAFTRALEDFLK